MPARADILASGCWAGLSAMENAAARPQVRSYVPLSPPQGSQLCPVCLSISPRLLVCARDCWCVRWWHARQAWGGVRGEMWTFYVLNKKLDFPVFVSFPLPPPHTLTKSSDSRQTPQISSRGGPLTFPPICLCHHAFLERRHYHGHTQIAAAVHTTRSTQVRASARNSSYIVRSESPPN